MGIGLHARADLRLFLAGIFCSGGRSLGFRGAPTLRWVKSIARCSTLVPGATVIAEGSMAVERAAISARDFWPAAAGSAPGAAFFFFGA